MAQRSSDAGSVAVAIDAIDRLIGGQVAIDMAMLLYTFMYIHIYAIVVCQCCQLTFVAALNDTIFMLHADVVIILMFCFRQFIAIVVVAHNNATAQPTQMAKAIAMSIVRAIAITVMHEWLAINWNELQSKAHNMCVYAYIYMYVSVCVSVC